MTALNKVIVAAFGATAQDLLAPAVREAAAAVGAVTVQVNAPDPAFAEAFTLQTFAERATGAVTLWGQASAEELAAAVRAAIAAPTYAWQVEETVPLMAQDPGHGLRVPAMANLAFLRLPDGLAYADWQEYWQGTHTQVALDTQDTSAYVQNRVVAQLAGEEREVVAIVEEHFPEAAVSSMHVFYGSGGDEAELKARMTAMAQSCAKFGASTDLDLVSTARYTFTL